MADLWTTQGAAFVAGDRLLDAAPSGPRWLAEPEVAAVVVKVLREGAAAHEEELRSFCAARLARFKVPKAVRFAGELPRTESGKLVRRQL